MSYLFLVTIGPVQEFIAAARRTRDLWAGSQLLSELSRMAALVLRNEHQAELIFPAPNAADTELKQHDVVNRILAVVKTDKPRDVGEAVAKKVREELQSLYKATFDNGKRIKWPQEATQNHRKAAEEQVDDLIEIYWAAVKHTDDYPQDRADLEAALAARKNTRDFAQPAWASNAPKSSIDGLRESVIDESEYPKGLNDPEREQKIKQLFEKYGAKGAERLSGVDLLKRHYQPQADQADFPSTSHFAALPLIVRCEGTRTKGLADYLATLRRLYREGPDNQRLESMKLDERFKELDLLDNYDASILFASRLDEDLEGDVLKQARAALDAYRKDALGGSEPDPYYALLHADGDFMGRTIETLAAQGVEAHRKFSRALDTFASGVREIVEQHHSGALVYSGGDDVLAFLPLHTAVQCAKHLADSFAEQMDGFTLADKPSLSVGIAICHHLEPLSDALNLARDAEKMAKRVPGKNALAITLSKRGSGDRTIKGSWEQLADENNKGFFDRLQKLTEWHRQGAIPDSAAYDLHDLIKRLGNSLPPAALKAEAVRIVKRKRGQRGAAEEANAQLVALAETLPTDAEAAKNWGVAQFADELIVTREFAKAWGYIDTNKQQGAVA